MAVSKVLCSIFGDNILANGLVVLVGEGGDDGDGGEEGGVETGVHPILTEVTN